MIDLHMHTKYSDGTDSVKEILINAKEANLDIISITDHNTCNAYREMKRFDVSEFYDGNIIVGCEFTTSFDGRLIEVLGYGFDYIKVQEYLDNYYSKELERTRMRILCNRLFDRLKQLQLIFNLENVQRIIFNNRFLNVIYMKNWLDILKIKKFYKRIFGILLVIFLEKD